MMNELTQAQQSELTELRRAALEAEAALESANDDLSTFMVQFSRKYKGELNTANEGFEVGDKVDFIYNPADGDSFVPIYCNRTQAGTWVHLNMIDNVEER